MHLVHRNRFEHPFLLLAEVDTDILTSTVAWRKTGDGCTMTLYSGNQRCAGAGAKSDCRKSGIVLVSKTGRVAINLTF